MSFLWRQIINLLTTWPSFFVAATIVLTMGTQVVSQTVDPWGQHRAPNSSDVGSNNIDQNKLPQKSHQEMKQDDELGKWLTISESNPLIDLQWHNFVTDYDKDMGYNDGSKTFRGLSAAGASKTPIDRFQVGNSYLGIKSQKTFQIPQYSWQPDCTTDDECADYSALPKAKQPKTSAKSFRKPFLGLSITTPIE